MRRNDPLGQPSQRQFSRRATSVIYFNFGSFFQSLPVTGSRGQNDDDVGYTILRCTSRCCWMASLGKGYFGHEMAWKRTSSHRDAQRCASLSERVNDKIDCPVAGIRRWEPFSDGFQRPGRLRWKAAGFSFPTANAGETEPRFRGRHRVPGAPATAPWRQGGTIRRR